LQEAGVENIVAAAGLADLAAAGLQPIPLGDSLAYSLEVNDKNVVITPRVPRNLSFTWKNRRTGTVRSARLEPQSADLRKELTAAPDAAEAYRSALKKLQTLTPDVWLPAIPMTGQNANLYDDRWKYTIDYNLGEIP
jgi:hypothetical protein